MREIIRKICKSITFWSKKGINHGEINEIPLYTNGNNWCYNTNIRKENKEGGDYMYSALDIAKWVVFLFKQKDKEITNLKLQKVLYYIQVAFLKTVHQVAFEDEIQAWRHGPVVPSVYYEYNHFVADPIEQDAKAQDLVQVLPDHMDIINEVVNRTQDIPAWTLVDETHQEFPWKNNYSSLSNNTISVEDIRKYAEGNA